MLEEKAKILAIDDDLLIHESLNLVLKDDFDIESAADPDVALDILKKNKIELILLDVELFGVSGFDIIPQIREICLDTPIVMLSATDENILEMKSKWYGVHSYINKPFDVDQLKTKVKQAVAHYRFLQRLS